MRLPTIQEIRLAKARKGLSYFTLHTKPDYLLGWVHKEICDELDRFLQDVADKKSPRLIITMPPRSGKSELVSRRFPAFALGRNPDLQIIATSYSSDLSQRFNRDVQRVIDDEQYFELFPKTKLNNSRVRTDSRGSYIRTSDLFEIVGHAGAYRSCGVGGGITGQGADILIIDDPIKDRAQAASKTIRDSIWDWYTSTAYTRLSPGGGVIVMATRWHTDDLIGRLIQRMGEGDTFRIVNYPAIAEHDELHRKAGEALHPERYPLSTLLQIQKTIGSRDWEALYQQHPVPDGGALFKLEWFRRWTATSLPPEFDHTLMSWDMTFKDSKNSDYVVGQVWGKKGPNFYLLDQVRGQWDFVKTKEMVRVLAHKWPRVVRKLVEDKANGSAVISELKSTVSGFVPITPTESKEARASSVTPYFEAGNVFIPEDSAAPWVPHYVSELLEFPAGSHDDQCFVAGTKVATLFGDKPIEKIKAGEMVLTPFGLKRVLFSGKTGTRNVISKFGVTATPDHPFITRDAEIKAFQTVEEEECIKLKYRNLINPILQRRLRSTALPIVSWDRGSITLASPPRTKAGKLRKGSMWLYGNSSLGKLCLKGFISIIRTATLSITNLAILSVYHGMNTARKLITKLKGSKNILTRCGRLQVHGIEAKKEEVGIASMLKKGFRPFINVSVRFVAPFLRQKVQTEGSAQESVKLNTDGITSATQSQKNVKSVVKSSLLSRVEAENPELHALEPVAVSSGGIEPVYNLCVSDVHMFFANGVLVHNCDATTQALNYFRSGKGVILTREQMQQARFRF
jgi:predicted phage terminase large subunit-like protein|nr:phage terminase large subunit [Parasutterella excrementihominis]